MITGKCGNVTSGCKADLSFGYIKLYDTAHSAKVSKSKCEIILDLFTELDYHKLHQACRSARPVEFIIRC